MRVAEMSVEQSQNSSVIVQSRKGTSGNIRRKLKAVTFTVRFLLAGMFVIVHVAAGVAKASSVPTNYYFTGYLGNNTIYMTTDKQAYYMTNSQGQALGSSAYQNASNNKDGIPNAIQLNLSNKLYDASGYSYDSLNDEFIVQLFFSAVGGSNYWNSNPFTLEAIGQKIGVKEIINGTDPTAVSTNIAQSFNTGMNITKTSTQDGEIAYIVETAVNIAITAAAVTFAPEIAVPVAAYGIMDGFLGIAGTFSQSPMTTPSNLGFTGTGSTWEWGQIDNGSMAITLSDEPAGHNVYGMGTMVQIEISNFTGVASSVGNSLINLFAQNEMAEFDANTGGVIYSNGSATSINVNMVQAVSIGGYAYLRSGVPDANSVVILQQDMGGVIVNFALKTNATGYWHFFAEPGATYTLSASFSNALGTVSKSEQIPSSDTGTAETGGNITVSPIYIGAGDVTGRVTDSANGYPISGATVSLADSSGSVSTKTNSNGYYTIYYPISTTYSMSASASGYYGASSTGLDFSQNTTYTVNWPLSPESSGGGGGGGSGGGGGGGGCVLYGTPVTLANGTAISVQDLTLGMKILSYNVSSGQFFNSTVDRIEVTNVTQVWEVDGIVNISGITTQPVYVQLQNGTEQWVYLGQLNSTMKIFDPLNGTWIPVTA